MNHLGNILAFHKVEFQLFRHKALAVDVRKFLLCDKLIRLLMSDSKCYNYWIKSQLLQHYKRIRR